MRPSLSLPLLAVLFFAGCVNKTSNAPAFSATELTERTTGLRAPYQPNPTASFQRVDGADPYTQPPTQRPGGDIVLGETHASRKVATSFDRANGNMPAAESILYYTDEAGAHALHASHKLPRAADAARADLREGYVSMNVRERLRGALPLLSSTGANYVVAKPGQPVFLTLRNTLHQPVEVLISIDDRELVDGQPASYRKRGYVIDPGDTVSVAAQLEQMHGQIAMAVFLPAGSR